MMALESETVETLEAAVSNAADRARLVDPLIVTLDAHPESRGCLGSGSRTPANRN